jgi:hypothetical protein
MRKKMIAVILGLLVFALVSASAAGLGTITTGQVGAEADVIATCDTTGVTVDFTTAWNSAAGGFVVTDVVLSSLGDGADECDGQSATVVVTFSDIDLGDIELGSGSATVVGAGATVTLSPTAPATWVDANLVDGIAIVVTG